MTSFSRLSLRTQLMLATVAVSVALTGASLWFVRHSMAQEVERQTAEAVRGSVHAFNRIQQQQQAELSQTAAIPPALHDALPVVNTQDPPTVQDATGQFLELSGSDAIVFGDTSGRLLGVRANGSGLSHDDGERLIARAIEGKERTGWWQNDNELFRYVVRPIIVGAGPVSRTVGVMVLARRTTDALAQDIGRVSGTEVVLVSGPSIVASTLQDGDRAQLAAMFNRNAALPHQVTIAAHPYEVSEVRLETSSAPPIRALLLFPLDHTYAFLARLTRIIVALGLIAVLLGALLVSFLANALTRPLQNLVEGAKALAGGNYSYSIRPRGSTELVGLGTAFISMREQLLESQRRQIEAERMAALGRAASSISHDLRHHLAALVANAEFLRDAAELGYNRDEIYREVQQATEQMTGLIDSLIEVARDRSSLSLAPADIAAIVRSAISSVRSRPEFRDAVIELEQHSSVSAVAVDARKLQRVFFNLLVNACEATTAGARRIRVSLDAEGGTLLCRVADNGGGIPASIRTSLFEPFVSEGKNNGTGLGLAIAKKIVNDHSGTLQVEQSSSSGTTFVLRLPLQEVTQSTSAAHPGPA